MKWISICEETPKIGDSVIVLRNDGIIMISSIVEKTESVRGVSIKWFISDIERQRYVDVVTHWMPLSPKP